MTTQPAQPVTAEVREKVAKMIGDDCPQEWDYDKADAILSDPAILAAMGGGGWRPIESAPRAGEALLLFAAAWEGTWGVVQVGHFEGDGEGGGEWVTAEGAVGENDPDFDPATASDEADDDWNIGPTHWQPLPAPPALQEPAR